MAVISADAQEEVAHSRSMEGDNETGTVYALLAIASAIERLAEVIENKE